jgi:23S rRNA pseudouridine955/2504/2580 synthase
VEYTITRDFHEVRLDRFLRKTFPDLALSGIFRMIRRGAVKVNGRKRKPAYRLQEGDRVDVRGPDAPLPAPAVDLLRLSADQQRLVASAIVHRSEDVIVCNKPGGLVMHRGSGHAYGLVELVRAHVANPRFTFVNRLDRDTAGLVIGACHPAALRRLADLFRRRAVAKYYLVMVEGRIRGQSFTRTSFLTREEHRVTESDRPTGTGKAASTTFTVLEHRDDRTLLEARLHTGRTHQLRVQLAGLGHPIVGDKKYGRGGQGRMLLFSRRLVIPALELDIELPVPGSFSR